MTTLLTYDKWDPSRVKELSGQLKDYLDVIKWAYKEYGDEIVYACSFGAEGIVLIDLISKINKEAKIIFLDTDLHFKETYELIDQIKKKYPALKIQLIKPKVGLEEQEKFYGAELWKHNPNLCCHIRKIKPLAEQLAGVKAWVSGLRREQSPTRKHVEYINKDEKFKSIKICPLIHWTWDDVWNYIKLNNLPYNQLHDQNYPSIGCENCTLPTSDPNSLRAGRWAQFQKTECGLHQN